LVSHSFPTRRSSDLNEEDYTTKGGKMLKAILPVSSTSEFDNIVDTFTLENLYGKDLLVEFVFDNNDLATVQGEESLRQTFATIMSTTKGGIPEFPDDGIPDSIKGTNENIIQYPILFRSILSMLQKDKRFRSFEILNISKTNQGSIFIETQTQTIVGTTLNENIGI